MTNEAINNAILRRRGYKQYVGNKDNLSPLMYFFLMDASKQVFDSVVCRSEYSGPERAEFRKMKDGFHLFFKNFFSAFDQEQTDYLIDKVDSFEEYIQHHLDIAEIALQECVNDEPIDLQREISGVWLCNILASDAQDFHGECWKTSRRRPLSDAYIDRVVKASKRLSMLRFGEGPEVTQKKFDRLQSSVKVIAKKVCEWIYEDYKQEIKKKNEVR